MSWELRVSGLQHRAVLEVLDGATATSVAPRFEVCRTRFMCGCGGRPPQAG
jgi:hypothetical protein